MVVQDRHNTLECYTTNVLTKKSGAMYLYRKLKINITWWKKFNIDSFPGNS